MITKSYRFLHIVFLVDSGVMSNSFKLIITIVFDNTDTCADNDPTQFHENETFYMKNKHCPGATAEYDWKQRLGCPGNLRTKASCLSSRSQFSIAFYWIGGVVQLLFHMWLNVRVVYGFRVFFILQENELLQNEYITFIIRIQDSFWNCDFFNGIVFVFPKFIAYNYQEQCLYIYSSY